MAISRRQFFKTAAGAAVAAALAPPIIELLEETVRRTFFLPPAGGWPSSHVYEWITRDGYLGRLYANEIMEAMKRDVMYTNRIHQAACEAKIWVSSCKPFEERHLDWQSGFA